MKRENVRLELCSMNYMIPNAPNIEEFRAGAQLILKFLILTNLFKS